MTKEKVEQRSLPRELQLIVDDIASQNCHLLEWEVFGNASDDMRIVLTWRRVDANNPSNKSNLGKWKLRQKSINLEDDAPNGDTWESKAKGDGEEEEKSKATASSGDDEGGRKDKKKKKNPFRKLKKDEKVSNKGKLQLSLSIDNSDVVLDEEEEEENSKNQKEKEKDEDKEEEKEKSVDENQEQEKAEESDKRNKNNKNESIEDSEETNNEKENEEEAKKLRSQKSKSFDVIELEPVLNAEGEEIVQVDQIKSEDDAIKMLEYQRKKMVNTLDENEMESIGMEKELAMRRQSRLSDISEFVNGIKDSEDEDDETKKQKKMLKSKKGRRREGDEEVKRVSEILGKTGWEKCNDCKYNGFCDEIVHKKEYLSILLADEEFEEFENDDCSCNVCKGGAVHNGCVYRELMRLKHDFKLFDKRNLCLCKVCVPFKYRKMCLRQELRTMRLDGKDVYYRLTFDGEDGNEGYHPERNSDDSIDSTYHSDGDHSDEVSNAIPLENIDVEIGKEDKIDFRNCIDCQFNGFCDNIRHKKLYGMLLRIDYEDFEDLEDECGCLVCEFSGAAHSGCAKREIKRLKYDVMLYDKRNLCYCHSCVPFKYRSICLRQEMKLLLRNEQNDLYKKL